MFKLDGDGISNELYDFPKELDFSKTPASKWITLLCQLPP